MRTLFFLSILVALAACTQTEPPAQYSIEQFYNNTRIGGGAFSDDESKMLVYSDESGIFNLYEIDISDASKKQITFSEVESFFAVDYVPGTGQILYSADKLPRPSFLLVDRHRVCLASLVFPRIWFCKNGFGLIFSKGV